MCADNHFIRFRIADFVGQFAVHDSRGNVPEEVLVAQRDALDLIKRAQNVFVGLHSKRAEEDRPQELAFAVDTHVQDVLRVVFELYPRTAVRDDFPEEVAAVVGALEKHSRRTV